MEFDLSCLSGQKFQCERSDCVRTSMRAHMYTDSGADTLDDRVQNLK